MSSMQPVRQARPVIDLERYLWRARLLLVFAQSPAEAAYREQQHSLVTRRHDLAERDLLVFALFDEAQGEGDGAPISPAWTYQLRQRFGLSESRFAVIVVGKDGGQKLRSGQPVPVGDILGMVDSIPMRQEELRRRGA
jgi:hypothetical protein